MRVRCGRRTTCPARGVAIVVALDVSTSMDAQDVIPSRIERAKLAVRDLLAEGDGLVVLDSMARVVGGFGPSSKIAG